MFLKVITFPFWVVWKLVSVLGMIGKMIFSMGFGSIRFIFSHLLGTLFGALIGFLLGKKHIGVKLFTSRKAK